MTRAGISCDIFCRVVDNFGDIGVAWRLARQLAQEHRLTVRLFVDDLDSFHKLEPAISISADQQQISAVSVMHWDKSLCVHPGQFVIEAFAVDLPDGYIAAMAEMPVSPVWINLEHLSAESWVGEHHLLPSPHPRLPLTKYFFFPGFLPDTGGLIRERHLLAAREAAMSTREKNHLQIFLFGYGNAAAGALVAAMRDTPMHVRCTIPEGALATMVQKYVGPSKDLAHRFVSETIAFTPQQKFDALLWQHDILFVRGEDSFVRAQWAGKPFVWQPYPQSDHAHWLKLNAFLVLYCVGLDAAAAATLQELWRVWNAEDSINIGAAWRQWLHHLPALQTHAKAWSQKLALMPDLAANLLSFYQKTTKI